MSANGKDKLVPKTSKQLGKYSTEVEAVRTKNEPLITLLKKLDVRVVSK